MIWNNKEIVNFAGLMEVMDEIHASGNKDDATRFIEEYEKENPEARGNIGYLTGYYDSDVMVQMQSLFKVAHPVFGYKQVPDPLEAFNLGASLITREI